jgi:hypothetical protein
MARLDGMGRFMNVTCNAALHDARDLRGDGPALRAAAASSGYIYLPGLLAPHEVDPLRRKVLAICADLGLLAERRAEVPRARPGAHLEPHVSAPWIELQKRIAVCPSFVALARHPSILAVLSTLFATRPALHRGDVCRVFLPEARELDTPPHQDLFFLRRSGFHRPEEIWSAWIPLDDGSPELGGLALVPGSHRGGLRAHHELDERGDRIVGSECESWAAVPMQRGDVVFLSCLTVHCGLANRTRDRIRLSVDYRYQPERDAGRAEAQVQA